MFGGTMMVTLFQGVRVPADVEYPAYPSTVLAQFRQKTDFRNYGATPYAQITDVADPDEKYGATAAQVVIRESAVGNPQYLAPATALAEGLDVRNGNIVFNFKPISNFGLTGADYMDRLDFELHSEGTPASPTANYHKVSYGIGSLDGWLRGQSTAVDHSTPGRWQTVAFGPGEFIANNTGADLESITFVRVAVRVNNTTNYVTWLVGDVLFQPNPRAKAACIFRFDDAHDAAYTYVKDALAAYGWGAMLCPGDVQNQIGQAGRLTAAQVQELCNDFGWQFAAQAWSTEDVATLAAMTEEERLAEFAAIRAYAQSLGLRPDSFDGSYFSGFKQTRLDVFPEYAATFRTAMRFDGAQGGGNPLPVGETFPLSDAYNISALNGAIGTSGATRHQQHIDQAIANKGVAIFAYHEELGTAGQLRTDFETTLAYLDANRSSIDVLTMKDLIVPL